MNRLRPATITLLLAAYIGSAPAQTYTLLHSFGGNGGGPNDPRYSGIMAQSHAGNLFSTAPDTWTKGQGTAFKITTAGAVTILHSFNGPDGDQSISGLTLGTGGHYWGTTADGGLYSHGTIFKLTAAGDLTTLHDFTGGADGGNPGAPPIEGIDGNFYGTTGSGGGAGNNGTVYRMTPSGVFHTLHSFGAQTEGTPNASLVQGTDGFLYGTTFDGGTHGLGIIFKMNISGHFQKISDFDGTHGSNPFAALTEGSDGNFYGVASGGGSAGGGVVFKIMPSGTLTVLHNFTGGSDGNNQVGGLLQATDGNFYGTNDLGGAFNWGVLFRITSGGGFAVLHDFDWPTGASPQVTLLQHTNGRLYGDTAVGGSSGEGTFFSFDVGLGPFVSFLPRAREVGRKVKFLGQGFVGTSAVSFNGTPATFTVVSDTYLTATVPNGATSGFITVSTPGGALKSNKKFLVKPKIITFSPANGPVGTSVVISGVSLKQTSKVTFNGVVASSFLADSDSQVTATVPAGATTGRIAITTTGAPADSVTSFTVTP